MNTPIQYTETELQSAREDMKIIDRCFWYYYNVFDIYLPPYDCKDVRSLKDTLRSLISIDREYDEFAIKLPCIDNVEIIAYVNSLDRMTNRPKEISQFDSTRYQYDDVEENEEYKMRKNLRIKEYKIKSI